MSELIDNSKKRRELLKHLILQLHEGEAPEQVKSRLIELLRKVPYNEVFEVEQELINEGLPAEEVLRFCDIHKAVLDGSIDTSSAKIAPVGHPVDTFIEENRALTNRIEKFKKLFEEDIKDESINEYVLKLKNLLNEISDVDKHYKRKEYLLFPYLEKAGIKGPPVVMWGKHDETRAFLKDAHERLNSTSLNAKKLKESVLPSIEVVLDAISGMILKEEEILFPMSMDTLTNEDWYKIYVETPEIGFCLYDPEAQWKPDDVDTKKVEFISADAIRLSSGSFDIKELEALFVTLPIDITYVDKDDKVKFFSHSPKRVFERNRSIIGRDVRMCHPPHSVNIVEQIISDFKSGKENKAAFWIENFKGRFVYIEYTALRGKDNEYLGVIETTQDITDLKKLQGDKRLLSYSMN